MVIYLSRQDRSGKAQSSCGSMTRMREELMVRLLIDDTSRKGDERLAESKRMVDKLASNCISLLRASSMETPKSFHTTMQL